MKTVKLWQVFVAILCLAFIVLVVYGINTDCPKTVGYVYCGSDNGWSLQKWSQEKVGIK